MDELKSSFIKFVIRPLFLIVYLLSGIFTRNNRVLIFSSWCGKRFSDNTRYFILLLKYLEGNKVNRKKLRYFLIADKKVINELPEEIRKISVPSFSLKSVKLHLISKYFFTDVCFGSLYPPFGFLSRRANIILLWHGIPMKKLLPKPDFLIPSWELLKRNLYFLCTSNFQKKIFSNILGKNIKYIIAQYPRNIPIIKEDFRKFCEKYISKKERDVIKKLRTYKTKKGKILLFLPTFRQSYTNPYIISLINEKEKIEKFLKRHNLFLIIKLHPFEHLTKINEIKDCQRILLLPPSIDIYIILKYIDMLITDYSSIVFDFLLTGKKILLLHGDIKRYKKERGLCIKNLRMIRKISIVCYKKNLLKCLKTAIKKKKPYVVDSPSTNYFFESKKIKIENYIQLFIKQ